MPAITSPERERIAINAIMSGKKSLDAAAEAGVSVRGLHAILRRHGINRPVGRVRRKPPRIRRPRRKVQPLNVNQQRLVEEHMEFAKAQAVRFWRERGERYEFLEDWIACAYYGLVRAAALFVDDGQASFRTMSAYFIRGSILNFQMRDMRANGFAWKSWRGEGLIQGAQRVAWPVDEDGNQREL